MDFQAGQLAAELKALHMLDAPAADDVSGEGGEFQGLVGCKIVDSLSYITAMAFPAGAQGKWSASEIQDSLPSRISALRRGADELHRKREYFLAIRRYGAAIRLCRHWTHQERSMRASLHHNRAASLIALQWYDEALVDLDAAICFESTWVKPYYLKGAALLGLGRRCEALRYFTYLVRERPDIRLELPWGTQLGCPTAAEVLRRDELMDVCPAPADDMDSDEDAAATTLNGNSNSNSSITSSAIAQVHEGRSFCPTTTADATSSDSSSSPAELNTATFCSSSSTASLSSTSSSSSTASLSSSGSATSISPVRTRRHSSTSSSSSAGHKPKRISASGGPHRPRALRQLPPGWVSRESRIRPGKRFYEHVPSQHRQWRPPSPPQPAAAASASGSHDCQQQQQQQDFDDQHLAFLASSDCPLIAAAAAAAAASAGMPSAHGRDAAIVRVLGASVPHAPCS